MSDTYTIRASSWAALFDCAHKWEGQHLLGMKKPAGVRALLGTSIHAGTAAFDTARMNGDILTVDDAAGVLVDTLRHPDFEVDYSEEFTVKEAEPIGISLLSRYCAEVSPRYSFVAVERTVSPLRIDCGHDIVITLTGTLDRSRTVSASPGIVRIADIKSGARAVESGQAKTKGHRAQVGTYSLLEEHTSGLVTDDVCDIIGMKTSGKPEVKVGEIRNAKQLLLGNGEQPGLLEFAKEMFRSGLFPPNNSSHLCTERYCARWASCLYHD